MPIVSGESIEVCTHYGYDPTTCPACNQSPDAATLRDQFAMAAPEAPGRHKWEFELEEEAAAADAEWRYTHADAMLAAREKKP